LRSGLSRPPQQRERSDVTTDLETAVHYRYVEPLLATGRIPNSREVAERLGVPIEEVQRALRSLANTHGVVLHTHVCEPWVIHPFSASPTATWGPLSAEFPPVSPRPACVAVPLERRYPRAAPGVFACDLALDPVRPWIGSDMSARLLSASGRILRPKTASPPFRRSCSQSTTGVH